MTMIKVSVLYPNHEGTKFDMTYYLDHHVPMVRQLLKSRVKRIAIEQGISALQPGAPATYATMCHLLFDSVEDFQSSFSPHADAIIADISNYTNTQPIIQISDVIVG